MYAVERQRWIVDQARAAGRVEVAEIARVLDVAMETVRRDLGVLEKRGFLQRVHGGAVPTDRLGTEVVLSDRDRRNRPEKELIALRAADLLGGVGAVYLDEGSTVRRLAETWHPRETVTVVTNALETAALLVTRPNVTVLLLGGRVRPTTSATVEHWTTEMLAGIVLDVAVLGTNGATPRHGLTCPDAQVAAVKAAAIRAARRRMVLADSTKFATDSLYTFARWDEIETIVTDRSAPADVLGQIAAGGVEVVRAGQDQNLGQDPHARPDPQAGPDSPGPAHPDHQVGPDLGREARAGG